MVATAADVWRIALALEGTIAVPHADRTAFRVRRNYATLAPDGKSINVDLRPDEQQLKATLAPDVYVPLPNKWGERGATTVYIEPLTVRELEVILQMAWEHGRSKAPIHRRKPQ
jgi:hypothetical protein